MKKRSREVLGAVLMIGALLVIGVTLLQEPTISGYAIYTDGCNSTISASGVWELNSSLSCSAGDGITVQASDVVFDCNAYPIVGAYDSGSSAFVFNDSLTNVSLQDCNVSAFTDPIVVGSGTNVSITGTYVEQNETCVTGDWADGGDNTGCILSPDTTAPVISTTNSTVYTNESLSYQIVATDNVEIANYTINNTNVSNGTSIIGFLNSSVNMTLNTSSGLIENTTLPIADTIYVMEAIVTDTSGNAASRIFSITVLNGTVATSPVSDDDDDDDDDDSSSSSSSSATAAESKICGETKAWECSPWAECGANGKQKRTCTKLDVKCSDPLPPTKRDCVEETIEAASAEASDDAKEEENLGEGVVITGGAITAFDRITNSVKALKGNLVIIIAVLALIVGFVLTLVLNKHNKRKGVTVDISNAPAPPKEKGNSFITRLFSRKKDDDSNKLWEWEESHTKGAKSVDDKTQLYKWEEGHK